MGNDVRFWLSVCGAIFGGVALALMVLSRNPVLAIPAGIIIAGILMGLMVESGQGSEGGWI